MKNIFNSVKKSCLDTGLFILTSCYHYGNVVAESNAYSQGINNVSLAWELIKAKCTVDSWRGFILFPFPDDWGGQEQSLAESTEPSAVTQQCWGEVVRQLKAQIAKREERELNESILRMQEESKLACQELAQAIKALKSMQTEMRQEAAADRLQLDNLSQGINKLGSGVAALSRDIDASSRDDEAVSRHVAALSRDIDMTSCGVAVLASELKTVANEVDVITREARGEVTKQEGSSEFTAENFVQLNEIMQGSNELVGSIEQIYSDIRLAPLQSMVEQVARAEAIFQYGNRQGNPGMLIVETAYDSDYEGQPFPDDDSLVGSELTIASGPSQ